MTTTTKAAPLGVVAVKDRTAYRQSLLVYVRLYVGVKGFRRFAGEICLKDHEWDALVADGIAVEAVSL